MVHLVAQVIVDEQTGTDRSISGVPLWHERRPRMRSPTTYDVIASTRTDADRTRSERFTCSRSMTVGVGTAAARLLRPLSRISFEKRQGPNGLSFEDRQSPTVRELIGSGRSGTELKD